MATKRPQDGLHNILKPIRYHGEGKYHRKLVLPGETTLSFSHLDDAEYALVLRTKTIAPVEPKTKK